MSLFQTMISAQTDTVIGYLTIVDFDHMRTTASTIHRLILRFERQLLRHTVSSLSRAGQATHIVLQDLHQRRNWPDVINIAGCLTTGAVGRGLGNLQERLTLLRQLWEAALTAATDLENVDAEDVVADLGELVGL